MSREEIIRIFRSETIGATPSGMTAGELATNLADRKLFIGGTHGDNITFMAISSITGTANEIDVMVSATGSVVIGLVGSAGSLVGLATTSLTGVASFDPRYFTVGTTGHVGLTSAYQVTGQTVVSGYGINTVVSGNTVTVNNIGVTGFNGLSGNVSMTGAGALVGRGNNIIDARLATDSLTGVASFNSTYLTVSNGAVSLASAYQVTGQTVVSGYGINTVVSNNTVTVNNIGVTGFNGLSGNVSITGSGALFGFGNNAIGVRNASASVTGVASFNSTYLTVSNVGVVSLASAYQVTGQTVVSGYGINTVVSGNTVTVNNIGVTGFNGLSGNVSMTGAGGALVGRGNNTIDARLATDSLTGVASFSSSNFAVSGTGHVTVKVGGIEDAQLASSVKPKIQNSQDLNDSSRNEGYFIVYDPNTQGHTGHPEYNPQEPGIDHFYAPISSYYSPKFASASVTGVASFDPRHFALGASGHVSLTGAYQVTGQTVVSGYGINTVVSNNTVTVNNTGVTGFNGLSGNVSMTGAGALFGFGNNAIGIRNASASVTGVASFNSAYLTVSNGAVSLASAYQVTGQTVVSGYGINTVVSNNTVTVNNTGVTGFNGLSGNVSMTGAGALFGFGNNAIGIRNASASVTGVASFDPRYFTVGSTGHVGLTATFFSAESELTYPVGGFSANGFTGDRLLLATGPANDPFRNYIRYENQWFQTGVVGVVGVTGDFGAVQGKPQNLITARLATASLTGVASFDSTSFKVTNGKVTLTTTPFVMASSGLGATGDEDGNLVSLYLDLNNVADYDVGKTLGVSDAVFVYDLDESGIIKTKKTTIGKMLLDTDAVFSTSTQNQLQKSKDVQNNAIKYGVVLGSIEPTSLGLIIGASAYEYFTQNTIKSFNGCTGDIGITGTANQVIVTGISCSEIVIGLPTSITITGTMNAGRFIGRMDGGAF